MSEIKTKGAPSLSELKASPAFVSGECLKSRGAVAVIECVEEIPCNPCESACPFGAISVGEPITNLPAIDLDKCSGCAMCVAQCPGLAITVKDYNHSDAAALISFPYEYLPLPQKGDVVKVAGRYGQYLCDGTVIRVVNSKANNRTPVVTVEFNKEFFDDAITIKR